MRLFSLLMVAMVCVLSGCGQAEEKNPAADGEKKANPVVVVETTLGNFEIELYPDKAPVTVANFLGYVNDKFFDDTIFHRVIGDFMIQGGGFTKDLAQKKTKDPIKIESDNGLSNDAGTVAMARTPDPNSAAAEFFVNVVDNKFLNFTGRNMRGWGYTVFGKVSGGMDVVNKIKSVKVRAAAMMEALPVETITIKSIRLKDK
jgi:cyclophilin family peptidyl-prolyl cis-trans isomerase